MSSGTQMLIKFLRMVPKALGGAVLLLLLKTAINRLTYKNARFIWLLKRNLIWIFARILPVPTPIVVSGFGSTGKIAGVLRDLKCSKPLIVTDKVLHQHGLLNTMLESLDSYAIYDGVIPDPPTRCVEEGYALYKEEGCDSLIAFGGGSVMDTAKIVGAKIANPKPVAQYEGVFNINMFGLRPLPPFIAVPTTAGTGSETTVAAIITNEVEETKLVCIDLGIVPAYAVLDPSLIQKLPKSITAATGLDALTHATEAYINGVCTSAGDTAAVSATTKVFKNLERCYINGDDTDARQEMLLAAFQGGCAITNGSVGYVHAIAHQLGALCHTPHGFACALVLPHVLEFYILNNHHSAKRLSEFAVATQVCPESGEHEQTAELFISKVKALALKLKAPITVDKLKEEHVKEVVDRAMAEAHGSKHDAFTYRHIMDTGYPVPRYMTYAQCEVIVRKLLPAV